MTACDRHQLGSLHWLTHIWGINDIKIHTVVCKCHLRATLRGYLATRCTLQALASRISHYIKPRCELCRQKVAKLWANEEVLLFVKLLEMMVRSSSRWDKSGKPGERCQLFQLFSILNSVQWLNQQHFLNIKWPSWVDNSIWNLWSLSLFHRTCGTYREEIIEPAELWCWSFRQVVTDFTPKAEIQAKTPVLSSEFRWGKAFNL